MDDPERLGDVEVRFIQSYLAGKDYICPNCNRAIPAGTGHYVVVPVEARRPAAPLAPGMLGPAHQALEGATGAGQPHSPAMGTASMPSDSHRRCRPVWNTTPPARGAFLGVLCDSVSSTVVLVAAGQNLC